jgi:hypothetical protein
MRGEGDRRREREKKSVKISLDGYDKPKKNMQRSLGGWDGCIGFTQLQFHFSFISISISTSDHVIN